MVVALPRADPRQPSALLRALATVYLFSLLALGLVISSRAKTQMEAIQLAQGFLLPSVFLSGYVFPLFSLPGPAAGRRAAPAGHALHQDLARHHHPRRRLPGHLAERRRPARDRRRAHPRQHAGLQEDDLLAPAPASDRIPAPRRPDRGEDARSSPNDAQAPATRLPTSRSRRRWETRSRSPSYAARRTSS